MNISLLTYGTRGDVQPLMALAVGLQNAGHRVRFAAPQRFGEQAARYALPFAPLPGDPEEMSRRINNARGPAEMLRSMSEYTFSIAGDVARAAFAACDDAQLIVHGFFFTTGAHSLARKMGVPDVSVQTMPLFAPTRAFPNPALPGIPPGALSAFSHWMFTQAFWHVGNFGYSTLRGRYPDVAGMKLYWPFDARKRRPTPLLFAYSPAVLPRPTDWSSPHIHVTGYLFLDAPQDYAPPAALTDFLRAADPPVCVSFGSMLNRDAERTHATVLAALKQAGKRAVIVRGWSRMQTDAGPNVMYIDDAPYDWLLPLCQSVVHHGGAGTTGAALLAGVPGIVVPHGADQLFWGRRVQAIGAGPAPIPLKRLTVSALAAALRQCDEPAMREQARRVASQVCGEDGVDQAVRLIEGAR